MRWLLVLLALLWGPAAQAQSNAVGYNNSCAAGLVASCVLKTTNGVLYQLTVSNWTATALTVYLVDANAVPTGGGAAIPAASVVGSWGIAVGAATSPAVLEVTRQDRPIQMLNGIVALCSTTGQVGNVVTFTASATCTFTAQTQ